MERTTAAVVIALSVCCTIILTAFIVKWYLTQKVALEHGYTQEMQSYSSQLSAVWVKKN